jgi:hypothetical protein
MSSLNNLIDLAPERKTEVVVQAGGEILRFILPTTFDDFMTIRRQSSQWALDYIEGRVFPPATYAGLPLATSEDVLASCWMLAAMDADPQNTCWLYSRLAAVHWEVFGQIMQAVTDEIGVSTVEVEKVRIEDAKKNCNPTACTDGDCNSPETCTEGTTAN